ncbi:carbohydrate sulfotransferase 1-like [Littorina saxatilis]|uniref:Sulfotransferase domain-containing protein n=1 Tax=Littorina saxatilis TaxID=31220 RepID=A0AAN9AIV2_9CAEN
MGIRKRRTAVLLASILVFASFYLYFKDDTSHQEYSARSYSDAFRKGTLGDLNPALFFMGKQQLRNRLPTQFDDNDEEIYNDISTVLRLFTDDLNNDDNEDVYDRDADDYNDDDNDDDRDDAKGEEKDQEAAVHIQQKDNHQARLVVVAYMRTGSSMTGRILQFSPDVFYWYEPLHSLERYYVTGGRPELAYRNKTMNEMFKNSAMAGGNVSAALSCDITNVYQGTLLDHFMTYSKYSTDHFHTCFKQAMTPQQWNRCAVNMTNFCREKFKVTAVKSIRFHMARALEAMRKDPKVKVVHLIRDPRGVLLSRHLLGFADFKKLNEEAALLCGKLKDDLGYAPKSGDPLRARYMMVRYEDIAAVPTEHTHQLYSFMGLKPSEDVLRSVKEMTESAKRKRPCLTCPPVPLNSTEVSQAWRQTLTLEQVETISKVCADVMRSLGYRVMFNSEAQLRDLRVSAVGPVKIQ